MIVCFTFVSYSAAQTYSKIRNPGNTYTGVLSRAELLKRPVLDATFWTNFKQKSQYNCIGFIEK